MSNNSAFFAGAASFDQYPNIYVTVADETIPATTQVIFENYLEVAASFFYELSTDAVLVIGDYATPLPPPDQNTNIFVTVNDELVPSNSEIVFSDFYELSAPFATEIATNGEIQVGTAPDIVGPFLPGYEIGYAQITAGVNIVSTSEATGTVVIAAPPFMFDGSPVLVEFFSSLLILPTLGAGDSMDISLFEGTTAIGRLCVYQTSSNSAATRTAGTGRSRFTPTAGLHTYTVTAAVNSTTGTPSIAAGTGGLANSLPAFVRFTKA